MHSPIGLSRPYVLWVFNHSRSLVGVISILTVVFGLRAIQTPLNDDLLRTFVDDPALIDFHLAQTDKFGDDGGKLMMIAADEGDQLFRIDRLNAIRRASERIAAFPEVQSVRSFVDAPPAPGGNLSGGEDLPTGDATASDIAGQLAQQLLLAGAVPDLADNLTPSRYWPVSPARQKNVDLDDLKAEVLADDRMRGKLISKDGSKHALVIVIDPNAELSIRKQLSLRDNVVEAITDSGVGSCGLYVGGPSVTFAAFAEQARFSITRLMPVGFVAIACFAYLVFRDFRVVLLITLIGGVAVIWALGASSYLFGEMAILVAAAPLVILAVSTTDFLHITTAYQQMLAVETDKDEAIIRVLVEVGGACILTSLTTFVGFGSMLLTRSPGVRQFGFATAAGTSVALLLMVTLLPIAFRYMKPLPVVAASPRLAQRHRWTTWLIARCDALSQRHPLVIFVFFLSLCIPAWFVVSGNRIDAEIASRFPADHELRQSLKVFDQEFTGVNSFELYVSSDSNQLFDPVFIETLAGFKQELQDTPDVEEVISVVDVFRGIDESVGYGTKSGLPPNSLAARASLDWGQQIEPDIIRGVVTPGRDQLRLRVMTRSMGVRATNDLAKQSAQSLSDRIKSRLDTPFQVDAGGTTQLIGSAVGDIIDSQIRGFFVCCVAITLIMIWGLGSLRVGVLAQIPNLIPVLLMVALVGITRDFIDSDMLALPMIALGIAVDDTIHFLHRYRLELDRTDDHNQAVKAVFDSSGRAIVISTIALAVALGPLAFADIISLSMLGTYLVVGLFGALVADLLCLPAMIHLGLIKYQ